MVNLIKDTIFYVLDTLIHDAVPLTFGIMVACILNVYIDPEKFRTLLMKRKKVSIVGSVAFGAFTPFCACGTMAIYCITTYDSASLGSDNGFYYLVASYEPRFICNVVRYNKCEICYDINNFICTYWHKCRLY